MEKQTIHIPCVVPSARPTFLFEKGTPYGHRVTKNKKVYSRKRKHKSAFLD